MHTLTTPITVPNIARFKVVKLDVDDESQTAVATVDVLGVGPRLYGRFQVTVKDSPHLSSGLAANPSPVGFMDILVPLPFSWATGYTTLATLAGANPAARLRAAESAILAAGGFPPGSVA